MEKIISRSFRLPETLRDKLREEARKMGHTVNALVLQILWEWVETCETGRATNGRP